MRLQRLIVPGLFVALGFFSSVDAVEPTKDSLDVVKKKIAEKKAVLLDVREKDEWDYGRLKDAVNLPLSVIEKGTTADDLEKIAGKDTIIYLHCAAGARSLEAAKRLAITGRDVRSLKPGYNALVKAGFPKARP
ncbi:MAG: rhodanese-like domain-containing protein [Planctomycetes bacterium]|nr:rhodanese-like domain-containing protein [Planctomycetota bacterium]